MPVDAGDKLDQLMGRYQAGDFVAARTLIEQASPRLLRFFLAQRASRADATDLLQETWLRIHRVRHTYRPGESVTAWLFAIARHVRLDHYRKVARTRVREERLEDVAETIAPVGADHDSDALEELLAPLSTRQREAIEMLKIAGMSLEEVARATSSSVGSVKQRVHRAYNILRKTMISLELKKGSSRGML